MSLDRDRLISLALSPEPTLSAPADLAERISQAVRETPQRRPLLPTQFFRPPVPAPVLRMVLLMLLMLALLGFSLVILSRPPGPAGVPMYHGGPERTGVLPGPGPAGEPFIAWQAPVAGPVPFSLMPIVADGRVIVGDQNGDMHALAETSGAPLWTEPLGMRASPLIIGDLVLAGLDAGGVVAVRAADGREVWRFPTEAPVSASLVAVDETVYVAGEDGTVYALDASSGQVHWSHDVGETVNRGPAVSDGIVYVAAYGGRVLAIDAATGEGLWSVELGPGEVSTPIVSGGRAYVGRRLDSDPSLVALDVADGGQLWEFRSALRLQVRPGALASDQLYVVSEDDNVYALDAATGELAWTHETGGRIGSLASLVGDVLYVSSVDGTVWALETSTGAPNWSVQLEGEPTIPVVVNGRVVVGTTAGQVVAIAGRDDAP